MKNLFQKLLQKRQENTLDWVLIEQPKLLVDFCEMIAQRIRRTLLYLRREDFLFTALNRSLFHQKRGEQINCISSIFEILWIVVNLCILPEILSLECQKCFEYLSYSGFIDCFSFEKKRIVSEAAVHTCCVNKVYFSVALLAVN